MQCKHEGLNFFVVVSIFFLIVGFNNKIFIYKSMSQFIQQSLIRHVFILFQFEKLGTLVLNVLGFGIRFKFGIRFVMINGFHCCPSCPKFGRHTFPLIHLKIKYFSHKLSTFIHLHKNIQKIHSQNCHCGSLFIYQNLHFEDILSFWLKHNTT